MQVVPDRDETEIIIETTANGYNEFHTLWRKAEAGESEFIPIFLPWSIDPEYRRKPDPDFKMDAEEIALAELHGLDVEQIAWRRAKIAQLGSPHFFAQEYPIIGVGSIYLFDVRQLHSRRSCDQGAARKAVEPYGQLIIGVDPAGVGADRTAIAWRRGRSITKVETRRGLDTMEVTG